MKRVIRRGVFETNSSSSHSLTLINEDKNSRYKKRDKFNIELKNRDEKVAMFFGLVEHAEETYKLEIDELGEYDDFYDTVCTSADIARKAYNAEKLYDSVCLWRDLFGGEFPPPPEVENSKSGGFTSRTEKTTSVPEGRFA